MSLNLRSQGTPSARPASWPNMVGTYIPPAHAQRAGSELHLGIPSLVDGKRVARTAPVALTTSTLRVRLAHC